MTATSFSARFSRFAAPAFAFCLASAAALSGCSNDAEGQCGEFIDAYCSKIVSCDKSVSMDKCLTTFKKTIDCSKASDAPSNFDKCPSDIQALKCTTDAPPVPDSCNISFRK